MKKKQQKSKPVKKSKKKAPKKKVMAIAAKPEFYNVQIEVPSKTKDGMTEYTYSNVLEGVESLQATEKQEELKAMGCGGRVIHLDGTPEGAIISTWGSVERVAAAEKIEEAAAKK